MHQLVGNKLQALNYPNTFYPQNKISNYYPILLDFSILHSLHKICKFR